MKSAQLLLKLSFAEDWETAQHEWDGMEYLSGTDCLIMEGSLCKEGECKCICGTNIKYHYFIENKITGNNAILGSTCIRKAGSVFIEKGKQAKINKILSDGIVVKKQSVKSYDTGFIVFNVSAKYGKSVAVYFFGNIFKLQEFLPERANIIMVDGVMRFEDEKELIEMIKEKDDKKKKLKEIDNIDEEKKQEKDWSIFLKSREFHEGQEHKFTSDFNKKLVERQEKTDNFMKLLMRNEGLSISVQYRWSKDEYGTKTFILIKPDWFISMASYLPEDKTCKGIYINKNRETYITVYCSANALYYDKMRIKMTLSANDNYYFTAI